MIEAAMYVALGFCTAGLLALAILPAFYRRASRLTEEALRAVSPMSYAEVKAAQDQERARRAVEMRRLETRFENERNKAAALNIETSKLRSDFEAEQKENLEKIAVLEDKLLAHSKDGSVVELLSAEVKSLREKLSETELELAESWKKVSEEEKVEEKPAKEKSKETSEASEWLPAAETMNLATITSLEAEVATLKAKLARHETTQATEEEKTANGTAEKRLSELETQLLDTKSKYVSAQAEVTRLSLILDSTNTAEPQQEQKFVEKIEELSIENASQHAEIAQKERTIRRLGGQIQKLRADLSTSPELKAVREELAALALKFVESVPELKEVPAAPKPKRRRTTTKKEPKIDAIEEKTTEPKPTRRRRKTTSSVLEPEKQANPSSPAKTSDIASAAEALVSRIVASSRTESQLSETETDTPPAPPKKRRSSSSRKPRASKTRSKDVA